MRHRGAKKYRMRPGCVGCANSAKIPAEHKSNWTGGYGGTKLRESHQACSSFPLLRFAGARAQPSVVHRTRMEVLFSRYGYLGASGCRLSPSRVARTHVCSDGARPRNPAGNATTPAKCPAAGPASADSRIQRGAIRLDAFCKRCGIAGAGAKSSG